MHKLVAPGMVLFTGFVSLPVVKSPPSALRTPAPHVRQDPRLETLRRFFEQSECPAIEYAHVFLEAADDYDLDWRLLPSISYIESTGGKNAANNNLFGWDGGRASLHPHSRHSHRGLPPEPLRVVPDEEPRPEARDLQSRGRVRGQGQVHNAAHRAGASDRGAAARRSLKSPRLSRHSRTSAR